MNQAFPQNAVPVLPDDSLVDIGRLINALLRHKWAILALALLMSVCVGLYVSSKTPMYRANATVMIVDQGVNPAGLDTGYPMYWGAASNFYNLNSQYAVLGSRELAERVVLKLGLHEKELAKPAAPVQADDGFSLSALLPASQKAPPVQLTPEQREQQVIQRWTGKIASGVQIEPIEHSSLAQLSYVSSDPQLAAKVLNTLAEEFIASNLEHRMAGTIQATDWLTQRLAGLKENLSISELALQDFREQEGLVDVEGVTALGSNELGDLARRLEDARRKRIEAQNIREEVEGLSNAPVEELLTIPAVLQHELISQLRQSQFMAQRRVAELAKRYGPKHPTMIAAQSDLTAANERLTEEVRKVVSGINREYELALKNEQRLQERWEGSKSELQDLDRTEFQLQELQREVDTNKQLYELFFTRLKSMSETGDFERPHARLVDRALVPGRPFSPNVRRSVILGFMIGLMLGCGVAVLLELLDNTIKTPDDVQDRLGVPLLGMVPRMELDGDGDFEQVWEKPQSQYAESIRTVRTGVVLSSLDEPAKVIVVTSTVPGEGKSTTVLNLGSALGQMERTLVIGADLRRPSLAKKCGLAPNHKGLSHFVSGASELDECIEQLDEIGVDVMPAGLIPANPLEMISSKRFTDALESLKARYSRIVIDSAPVQAVSDALILASYADSVIYVVKADSTPATQAKKGIASIEANNEPLTGVVLNHFDIKKASRYYGSKYYQYGEYYQAEEPA